METTVSCCWSRSRATDYKELLTLSVSASKARIIWRLLLTKFKKVKKNYMYRFSNTSTRFSYEAYEYAQNFDHGLMSNDDFEDLSRSFSARFAVPSNAIVHRKRLVIN